jgi:hypothetical protein
LIVIGLKEPCAADFGIAGDEGIGRSAAAEIRAVVAEAIPDDDGGCRRIVGVTQGLGGVETENRVLQGQGGV